VSIKAVQDPPPVRAFYLASVGGGGPVNLVSLGRIMERWPQSANVLFLASAVVELVVLSSLYQVSSRIEAIALAAALLIAPSFAVGYLAGELGLVYGLVLGVMPAIFALTMVPTTFFGLSPVGGALILFVVYVLLSALSGVGGQFLARWRDAA
jgi:hypothetical protein